MMIATVPVIVPLVVSLGYDPVWFGIFLVIMMELSLITPPVGMNLYVVQGIRKGGSVMDVICGALPFVAIMLVLTALIIYFPGIALWLPNHLSYPFCVWCVFVGSTPTCGAHSST